MRPFRHMLPIAGLLFLLQTWSAAAQRACDRASFVDAIGATPTAEFVPGAPGQRVYICGVVLTATGNAAGFRLVSGTGTNCATDTANMTNVYQLPNGGVLVNRIPFTGETTAIGHALCAIVTGTGTVNATVYWAQF
jgi:hypothetical protein